MKLSWIHISDLHVRSSSDYRRDIVSSKLISAVAHEEPAAGTQEQANTHVREEVVEELATVLHEPEEARILAERSGFSRARMPPFSTPRAFWSNVLRALHNGALSGGIEPLIEQAAKFYPGNACFVRLRRTLIEARARAAQLRLRSLIQHGAINAIFVTGDLVSRGGFDAYDQVSRFLDDLRKATGLSREHVFVVPGNHDVDREHMGSARTPRSAEECDSYFDSNPPGSHFDRLTDFADWYDRYFKGIREFPRDTTCGPVEVIEVAGGKVGVLPINTALFSSDDQDPQSLWIGRGCLDRGLDELSRRAPDMTFALMHHPLEYLHADERNYVTERLERSVDVVLRGHLHEDRASEIAGLRGRALHVAAGAAHHSTHHPRLMVLGRIEDRVAFIEPLRYDDDLAWHHDQRMFGEIGGSFELPRRRTGAVARRSHGDEEDRETKVELSAAELSDRTVARARGDDRVMEALVALSGLSHDAVRHRLRRAGSRVRLRNLFGLAAERSRDEADLSSLGSRTAASVRASSPMIAAIAAALDLTEKRVAIRLEQVDGRFRVRTVFADEWPDDDADVAEDEGAAHTAEDLAEWRVAAARDDDAALDSLAMITGLTRRKVKRRLAAADARTYLRNAFVNEWPETSGGDAVEASQVELGSRTVRSVRDDEQAIAAIAEHTGLGRRSVAKRLERTDGRFRVRTIFAAQWPDDGDDGGADAISYSAEDLAQRTVAAARDDDDVLDALVALTGLTLGGVRRRLNSANGRTTLRNLFDDRWPTDDEGPVDAKGDDAKDEEATHTADELAEWRVAAARDDDAVLDSLATITGLTRRRVKHRLAAADARTYLRNAFVNEWPETSGGDAVEAAQVELGSRTVRSVRDDEQAIAAISERTGLGRRSVSKRLERSDGRFRVRTIFAAEWSDDDDDGGADTVSYSAEDLAERTVAAVRDEDDVLDALVALTGLTLRGVRRRLNSVNGRTTLRNLFDDRWPTDDEDPVDAEDEGTYSAEALAEWTAAAARDDEQALDALSMITGMTRGWVRRNLNSAEGRTLVRNVLAHRWPESEVDASGSQDLGARTVASVREDPTAIAEICAVTGFGERFVIRRVEEFDGRYRVRTIFRDRWPREGSDDEGRIYSAGELAERTVASVRNDDDDEVFDSLVSLTGLAPRWVRRYLNGAEGRTLLRNALAPHWPSDED